MFTSQSLKVSLGDDTHGAKLQLPAHHQSREESLEPKALGLTSTHVHAQAELCNTSFYFTQVAGLIAMLGLRPTVPISE